MFLLRRLTQSLRDATSQPAFSGWGVLLLCVLLPSASVVADTEWIRPGTFVEWPDSLKGDPADLSSFFPEQPFSPIDQAANQSTELSSPVQTADGLFQTSEGAEPVQFEVPQLRPALPYPVYSSNEQRVAGEGWQLLPEGLLYRSYLAGEKESRFASQFLWEKDRGRIWEAAAGGRWGVIRKGTYGAKDPQGFQFDVEGAALVRIDPEEESDLEAADFRAGFIGTWRNGPWHRKFGYYHLSSHVGDEYMIKNPTYDRRNYVRDALILGLMYDINPDLQIYGEYAAALNANGGAQLNEFQVGIQYSPGMPTGLSGAPFAAFNSHFRQEHGANASVNIQAGWAWKSIHTDRLFRVGFMHYNGPAMQWSFVNEHEVLTGCGIWFDY